jgi:hypothetical protein
MFMGRAPKFWAAVGFFLVALPVVTYFVPKSYDVHRDLVLEQFHLPPDVEFAALKTGSRKGKGEYIEAIVQLTPEQHDAFLASLDDPAVWHLVPFEFEGIAVTAEPSPTAMQWHPDSLAVQAIPWVGWGHIHEHVENGPRRSFCFAVQGEGESQRIDGCTTFGPDARPDFYVRGPLRMRDRRLFVHLD